MSRYIDADELIDFIDVGHLRHPSELCFSEIDVVNLLLHAPTVDTVLVPRCCDCNNRNDDEKCPLCHVEYKTMFDYKTDDNGFCHKWERMVTSDGNV